MYEKAARMTAVLELARCSGYCSYMQTVNTGVWFVLSKLTVSSEKIHPLGSRSEALRLLLV